MKSQEPGQDISPVEVTSISRHGVRMLVERQEYFLSYEHFPWFRNARVRDVLEVELLHGFHLHWPALDVDLEIAAIEAPARFPLIDAAAVQDRSGADVVDA